MARCCLCMNGAPRAVAPFFFAYPRYVQTPKSDRSDLRQFGSGEAIWSQDGSCQHCKDNGGIKDCSEVDVRSSLASGCWLWVQFASVLHSCGRKRAHKRTMDNSCR